MSGRMNRLLTMALSFAVASTTVLTGYVPAMLTVSADTLQQEYYVSPDGNDENPGTESEPFLTIQRAQEEVRKVNKNMTGDIVVNVGAGVYYLDEAIKMDERDSGSNGHEVIYRSSDGIGQARIIGGERITEGWEKTTAADVNYDLDPSLVGTVYRVQLDPDTYDFNALYVNDEKATMARTRNYNPEAGFPSQSGEYLFSEAGGAQDIVYRAGDLDQRSIDGMVQAQERGEKEIAQLFVWDGGEWDWFTSTLSLGSIDPDARNIRAWTVDGQPEVNRTKYSVLTNARYYLQGNLGFMDVPGEYHYNKATGVLYYYPKAGEEDLGSQNVIVPRTKEIFRIQGSDKPEIADYGKEPDLNKQASNIRLDGLSLECTDFVEWISSGWNSYDASGNLGGSIPPEAEGSTNTSYCEQTDRTEFKIGAITMINTNHLTVENCRITNIGLFGIAQWRDNTYNTVKNCEISNVGYGGITTDGGYPGIGKYNNHHLFTNLSIHDVGLSVGHGTGITVMSTGQSEFSHIEIYNAPRRAMMVSGGIRRDSSPDRDGRYDEMTDMYTVGNTFAYFYVHHCEQDSGEDSAVYICMLLRGNEIAKRHDGISDPLKIINPETGEPYGMEKANTFSQFLIDSIGSTPSMHDKNTVHGMDLCMGVSGSHLSNIKGTNQQSCTLRVEEGNSDKFYIDNINNNYKSDYWYERFDESSMDYNKIGLTEEYPFSRYVEPDITVPDDVYVSDDFETITNLNPRKWTVEKGNAYLSRAYMAEGPYHGKQSLCIDGDQAGGVVVSRSFEVNLNKIVTMRYFDKRLDYATSDGNEGASSTNIRPHTFVRVDNGEHEIGLGADGDVSRDYYLYKNGDETVQTSVHRTFGWHTFQFDYSSGTEVKISIDCTQVAAIPAESFNYIAMGDWKGQGGKTYFDQFYIHGGQEAPPAGELPLPKPPVEPESTLYQEDFESFELPEEGDGEGSTEPLEGWSVSGKGSLKKTLVEDEGDGHRLFVQSPDNMLYFNNPSWENYIMTCDVTIDGWRNGLEGEKPWDNFSPAINYDYPESEKQPSRYALKFLREGGFEMYRRATGKDATLGFTDGESVGLEEVNRDHTGQTYKVEITTIDGTITMKLDGITIFEKQEDSPTSGGIGFDGINVEYYLDNIKVADREGNILFEDDFEGYSEEGSEPEQPEEVLSDWKMFGKGAVAKKVDKDPENEENQVLYGESQDNSLIYLPDEAWANYTVECRARIDSWGGGLEGDKPWDNFAVNFYAGETANVDRYALKFNRTGGFEAYKRAGGDTTLASKTAEEIGLTEQSINHIGQWYQVKIVTSPGIITMYIDGKEAFVIEDSGLTSGGFGFDGVNVRYFVDDIVVTTGATGDPNVDKEEGAYDGPLYINLIPADKGDKIFYTEDGSDPRDPEHGQYYIEGVPVILEESGELKFVAIREGQRYSNVITKKYLIGSGSEPADKEQLNVFIGQAEEMVENEDRYVSKNWQKLLDALEEAKTVLDKEDATDEEVQAAADVLRQAILMQRKKADKSILQKAVEKASAIDLSQYTEESAEVLSNALKVASAILEDDQMSEDDQDAINEAAVNVEAAIQAMVLKGGDGNGNGNGDGGNNGNDGSNGGGKGSGTPGGKTDKPGSVRTGDDSIPAVWGILAAAALSSGVLLIRKWKLRKK